MKPLTIIGAGGHGKVVADTAELLGYSEIVFIDQAWPERQTNGRWRITDNVPPDKDLSARFCAIGDNSVRVRLFERFDLWDSPVLCHPVAVLSHSARLGAGSFAAAGVVINADAIIGQGVILNTGCTVDHDCVLGDFAHISPGAHLAGGVIVGARSWIGIGAVVREGVRIGSDVVVAAGAAVIANIPDGEQVGGVPARLLRTPDPS